MQFHFLLKTVEEVSPWSEPGQLRLHLHWFGLTDGWFWIEVGDAELFRYSRDILEHWQQQYPDLPPSPYPYEDYQVARYWEDLLDMLPSILDPLPDDLAARVANAWAWNDWQSTVYRLIERHENKVTHDTYSTAFTWWGQRTWWAGHLTYPPHILLWRIGDTIHLRWDNRNVTIDDVPVWESQQGEITLSVAEFLSAVTSFHTRFLTEMKQRVDRARAAWPRPDVTIDLAGLERDQKERSGWLESFGNPWVQEQRRAYSWEEVRAAIAAIEEEQTRNSIPPRHEERE